jgi:hypothetical protein
MGRVATAVILYSSAQAFPAELLHRFFWCPDYHRTSLDLIILPSWIILAIFPPWTRTSQLTIALTSFRCIDDFIQ